ncbi:phosphate butyryltransferase [Metabacillus malikii]|uniref:phosphate butyryltransferase n=1 Tax=Metabacillus malikii TaxID=1504265 RepID=UPI0027D77BD5|nr:phosphate butyryltransferase [Metabacillus malikii]
MRLNNLLKSASLKQKVVVAIAGADNRESIDFVIEALTLKLAKFLLVGDEYVIRKYLNENSIPDDEALQIVHAISKEDAAHLAVRAVDSNQATILMKGNIPSRLLLKTVLNNAYGLKSTSGLSHVAVFEIPDYQQLLIVTDAAMNIAPSLMEKKYIIENAVKVANSIGIVNPNVIALAAVEEVNPSMQATIDAAALTLMNRRGQIKNCQIEGPLALDNAISVISARQKGIDSEIAGKADIIVVPNIEVGNVLYKSLVYFGKAKVGAFIVGAKTPIVFTSRADSLEAKLYSLALSICSL